MKKIVKYKAEDGSEWDSPEEAMNRDDLFRRVNACELKNLGQRKSLDENDTIQHDPAKVLEFKTLILRLAAERSEHESFRAAPEHVHPLSIVYRILSDWGGPLDKAWSRLCCIDRKGVEWQEAYFVGHGGAGY